MYCSIRAKKTFGSFRCFPELGCPEEDLLYHMEKAMIEERQSLLHTYPVVPLSSNTIISSTLNTAAALAIYEKNTKCDCSISLHATKIRPSGQRACSQQGVYIPVQRDRSLVLESVHCE